MTKIARNIHYLFYAIYLLGVLAFFFIPAFITLPIIDWALWACLFIGFVLHIRKERKSDKPMTRKKLVWVIICFSVAIAATIFIVLTAFL